MEADAETTRAIYPLPDVVSARTMEDWRPSEWQDGSERPARDGPYQRRLGRSLVVSWYRFGAWYMEAVRNQRSPDQSAPWRGLLSGRRRSL